MEATWSTGTTKRFLPDVGPSVGLLSQPVRKADPRAYLLIPLLKATQRYSFNDEKRQKLSQSPLSRRTHRRSCWSKTGEARFYRMLHDGIESSAQGPAPVPSHGPRRRGPPRIAGGINTLTQDALDREHDILLTSPPYHAGPRVHPPLQDGPPMARLVRGPSAGPRTHGDALPAGGRGPHPLHHLRGST